MPFFEEGIDWAIGLFHGTDHICSANVAGALAFAYTMQPHMVKAMGSKLNAGAGNKNDNVFQLRKLVDDLADKGGLQRGKDSRVNIRNITLNVAMAYLLNKKLGNLEAMDSEDGWLYFRSKYNTPEICKLIAPWDSKNNPLEDSLPTDVLADAL